MQKQKHILIIGAGATGLCAATELLKYPELSITILESQPAPVGGLWNFNSSRTSLYNSLRTNLPRESMSF